MSVFLIYPPRSSNGTVHFCKHFALFTFLQSRRASNDVTATVAPVVVTLGKTRFMKTRFIFTYKTFLIIKKKEYICVNFDLFVTGKTSVFNYVHDNKYLTLNTELRINQILL